MIGYKKLVWIILLSTVIPLQAQEYTLFDYDFWVNREAGMASYNCPDTNNLRYTGGKIYIDPSRSSNGDGSLANPLNDWPTSGTYKANTCYLQKAGTVADAASYPNRAIYADNVLIGAYGVGERPRLYNEVRIIGDSCVMRDVQLKDVWLGTYPATDVEHLYVYNCEFATAPTFVSESFIVGNIIHEAEQDAIFLYGSSEGAHYCRNNTIAWNHFYNVNMAWYPGADEGVAGGDAIQTSHSDTAFVYNNLIDRSATGNKFCVIAGCDNGGTAVLSLQNNIIYPPRNTTVGGAGVYLTGNVKGLIVNNKFVEPVLEVGLHAIYGNDKEVEAYGNLFYRTQTAAKPYYKFYNNTCIEVAEMTVFTNTDWENNIFSGTIPEVEMSSSNIFIDDIGADKLFVDPDNLDFRTKENSPAIDKGVMINLSIRATDMFGVNLPQNGAFDIGAFEYDFNATPPVPEPNVKVYPNPTVDYVYVDTKIYATIKVLDIYGRTIYLQNDNIGINRVDYFFENKGLYFIQLISNNRINATVKLIVN
jgi:hypothetical protein